MDDKPDMIRGMHIPSKYQPVLAPTLDPKIIAVLGVSYGVTPKSSSFIVPREPSSYLGYHHFRKTLNTSSPRCSMCWRTKVIFPKWHEFLVNLSRWHFMGSTYCADFPVPYDYERRIKAPTATPKCGCAQVIKQNMAVENGTSGTSTLRWCENTY
jgi:hypothetical protein